jgi:hypothetical protein
VAAPTQLTQALERLAVRSRQLRTSPRRWLARAERASGYASSRRAAARKLAVHLSRAVPRRARAAPLTRGAHKFAVAWCGTFHRQSDAARRAFRGHEPVQLRERPGLVPHEPFRTPLGAPCSQARYGTDNHATTQSRRRRGNRTEEAIYLLLSTTHAPRPGGPPAPLSLPRNQTAAPPRLLSCLPVPRQWRHRLGLLYAEARPGGGHTTNAARFAAGAAPRLAGEPVGWLAS